MARGLAHRFVVPSLALAVVAVEVACDRKAPAGADATPVADTMPSTAPSTAPPAASASPGAAARGEALFASRCALCHRGGGQGPDLGGVVGRAAASGRGYPYSRALRAHPVVWDSTTLDAFLKDPLTFAPGTRMPVPVPDARERGELIAFLATLPARKGLRPAVPLATATPAPAPAATHVGRAAMGGYRDDGPGVLRTLRASDLPPPFQTPAANNPPLIAEAPPGAALHVPPGFTVAPFAQGLEGPRVLRVAPNGDVFVALTYTGAVHVLRPNADGTAAERDDVFAQGLQGPFGIAFYPPGDHPSWVYVANTNSVVRFAYGPGDTQATGLPEVIVPALTESTGGHSTRDVALSRDGSTMFVSVGSGSNVAQTMPVKTVADAEAWEKAHGLGASWGDEADRADVLAFDPTGGHKRTFATGIRNCVGLAVSASGDLWCSTNERDGLGDDLVPDYVTRVRPGAFYGWPWYYMGAHEDPRHAGERPDLASKVTVPEVLLTPHSASLEMTFYDGHAFPNDMIGDAFAALHGSWNRATRTGYKVVRVKMAGGAPTGQVEDFLTGFVIDDDHVWGRPVGVAVGKDGALYVSDDAGGAVYRVAYRSDAK